MAYILFKNISNEEIDKIINFLNGVSKQTKWGPEKENALGVCTTTFTNSYTYLDEDMCRRDNPYISWIMSRKEYFTVDDFIKAVEENVEEYNLYYKEISERYDV